MAAPSRMEQSVEVAGGPLLLVQRDNGETDELRAREASQSSGARGVGCLWLLLGDDGSPLLTLS